MPYSYGEFKEDVKQHFLKYIPTNTKILDVGPGHGTYSKLLSNYTLDCIELTSNKYQDCKNKIFEIFSKDSIHNNNIKVN